jgi:phosphatidylinositol alpha-1,6-mannosyltransferase
VQPLLDEISAGARPIWWITHEFAPFRGGAGVYVQEIARAAARLSVPGRVVTVDYRSRLNAAEQTSMLSADAGEAFPVLRLGSSGRLTPGGILRLAAGLDRERHALAQSAPALMSVGAQMAAFLLWAAGRFPAGRAICFFHGSELLRFARHPFWRPLARRFYAQAAGFAAASKYVQDLAARSGLLPPDAPICLARCAVPSAYRGEPDNTGNRPEQKTVRILTVGRLHPRKGQLQVAEALALLSAELRHRLVYRVVGAGDPAYRALVESVCRDAHIRSDFLSDADERALAAIYDRCTVYAQASQTLPRSVEGFGISLLEAAYFGCPIAAFRSGGVSEAVRESDNALLVDEGDVPSLSAAIQRLIAEPELRQAFGAAGRKFARSFSWEDSARILCRHARVASPSIN